MIACVKSCNFVNYVKKHYVDSLLRLPTLGYTFVFPLGYALSRGCSCAVPLAPRDLHLICGVSVKRLQTTGDLQGGRGRSVDLFAFGL